MLNFLYANMISYYFTIDFTVYYDPNMSFSAPWTGSLAESDGKMNAMRIKILVENLLPSAKT